MKCRICHSSSVDVIGTLQPYFDYECRIMDCQQCGCRFAVYEEGIYEKLHSAAAHSYEFHNTIAQEAYTYYQQGKVDALRTYLSRGHPKNTFIISTIDSLEHCRNLLEIGCSKGYLTSYFIRKGYNIKGVEVSESAVQAARQLFGDHFVLSDSPQIERNAPYDAIYHVGTIGCVESPLEMTNKLLALLKPGGHLVFNAPNKDSCIENQQIWINDTPPPDLVTLFPASFWHEQFAQITEVSVDIRTVSINKALNIFWKKVMDKPWYYKPRGYLFSSNINNSPEKMMEATLVTKIQKKLIPPVKSILQSLGHISNLYPDPFGVYVILTKKP